MLVHPRHVSVAATGRLVHPHDHAQPSRDEIMGVICQMHSLDDPIGQHSVSRRARVPRGMRQANPGPAHLARARQARGAGVSIVNAISGSHSGRRKSLLRLCTRSAVRGAVPPRDRHAPEANALVGLGPRHIKSAIIQLRADSGPGAPARCMHSELVPAIGAGRVGAV